MALERPLSPFSYSFHFLSSLSFYSSTSAAAVEFRIPRNNASHAMVEINKIADFYCFGMGEKEAIKNYSNHFFALFYVRPAIVKL
jgi:hypothetical protein